MTLSPHLTAECAVARKSLEAEGRLALPRRRALWRSLYPDTTTEPGRMIGDRRLVFLNILAAQRVSSFWYAVFPDDDVPGAMLRLALDVAFDRVGAARAERERDAACVDVVENRRYAEGQESALFAGHAAIATVTAALLRELPDVAAATDDPDLDPESYEPGFLAAAAFGGLPWSLQTNPRKRLEFWSWYLEVAVPRACDLAQQEERSRTMLSSSLLEAGMIRLSETSTLAPGLEEGIFRASGSSAAATPFVHNGPHRSYRLPPAMVEGELLLPIVFFERGRLRRVSLHRSVSQGTAWDAVDAASDSLWTEALREKIERNLDRALPATFPWGQVSVSVDPRSGSAALTLEYTP